jgi:hypothetical protein
MDIQGYSDKETQYRNTSAIHHASDLTFVPTGLDVEPRLHQFNLMVILLYSSPMLQLEPSLFYLKQLYVNYNQ